MTTRARMFPLLLSLTLSQATIPNQKPELVVQAGHFGHVLSATFTTDGRILASGSTDGTVKLWDIGTGREFLTLKTGDAVTGVAVSGNGPALVAALGDGSFQVWDVAARRLERTIARAPSPDSANDNVYLAALSADGSVAAGVPHMRERIAVWETASGRELRTLTPFSRRPPPLPPPGAASTGAAFPAEVTAVSLSADGGLLAAATFSDGVAIWSVASGALRLTIPSKGLYEGYEDLAFSPDGRQLAASAGKDRSIRLFDTTTGKETRSIAKPAGEIGALAFSRDSRTLAGVSELEKPGEVDACATTLWDVATGKTVRTLTASYGDEVQAALFSPDGRMLVTAGGDILRGRLTIWDAPTGTAVSRLAGETAEVRQIAFGDGDTLVANDGLRTRAWRLDTAREHLSTAGGASFGLSADGTALAVVTLLDGAAVLDPATGAKLHGLPARDARGLPRPAAVGPAGTVVASHGEVSPFGEIAGAARVWNTATGEVRELPDPSSTLAFNGDGTRLAVGTYQRSRGKGTKEPYAVRLWDTATWQPLPTTFEPVPGVVRALAFSRNGAIIAVATSVVRDGYVYGEIRLQDVASGRTIRTLSGATGAVRAVAFSADARTVLGGGVSGLVIRWDAADGRALGSFEEHASSIASIAFTPDGARWASAGRDGQIVIHDAATDAEIVRWILIGDYDYAVVSPDGSYFTTRAGAPGALAFRFAGRLFPLEQFDLRLNRPDLVLARLGKAPPELLATYYQAFQKRLKRAGIAEASLAEEIHAPDVSIAGFAPPLTTRERTLEFTVKATDTVYPLARFNVYVNDTPIYGVGGLGVGAERPRAIERAVKLDLARGANKIQVSAVNERGAEGTATFRIRLDAPNVQPDLYVMAVGVSKYADATYNLTYAAKDASDLVALFRQRAAEREQVMTIAPGASGLRTREKSFYRVQALEILDADATREKILGAREFLRQAKPDDEVIVFFAGHGLVDDRQEYFFGTSDIDFANPAARGLAYGELEGLVDGVAARRKLVLVDTCHSGEVDKDAAAAPPPLAPAPGVSVRSPWKVTKGAAPRATLDQSYALLQELFSDLRRASGAAIISAASGVEFAYENSGWKNGVFTFALLNGLRNGSADADANGEVTVSELRDRVSATVRTLTLGRQTPTARRESVENNFRVY